ncbi:MAG: carboxylating nicotinate-nucleotide diphosphorylase [Bacteroidota bacterium]
MDILTFIQQSLIEDLGEGDHTTLSTISHEQTGKAKLLVKERGVIAGVELAQLIFNQVDADLSIQLFKKDGDLVEVGEIAFIVEGRIQSILIAERLVLNCMQRMSGIASVTHELSMILAPFDIQILDTRKTTPLNRMIEKWAVRIGGGVNHRFGLYDMILIKDNHVDSAGGIKNALAKASAYIKEKSLSIPIEIETRSLAEITEALNTGIPDRIMLDNFHPTLIKEAVQLINGQCKIEVSGGITKENILDYAIKGVNYISMGALTHSVKSLDLSLKIT